MSERQSALPGAEADGFVHLREMGRQGMVTLRGDLASAAVQGAVEAATAQEMPGTRQILGGLGSGVAWMSPDEVILFCDAGKARALAGLLGDALRGQPHLAVDVSSARAVFAIEGQGAREVLAKLCPVDMAGFAPGEIRRTRLAQVPAAFWMADTETVHLLCFRSVAHYAFDLLTDAAQTPLGLSQLRG